MTILVGKHIDQIDFDSGRSIHTLPVVIGERAARFLNIAAICAIYAIIAALIGLGRLTPFAAIVVFAFPRAVRAITLMSRPRPFHPHGYMAGRFGTTEPVSRVTGVLGIHRRIGCGAAWRA
jgi:1,4-dihydroxy-2-naphthoate octaprenyltransferase